MPNALRDDEDQEIQFTIRERRRIDRTERAVFGYADEGGVYVPGLLQNTADGVAALRGIKKLVYGIVILALVNALHLYGLLDVAKTLITGAK